MANEYKKYIAGIALGASLCSVGVGIPVYHLINSEGITLPEAVYIPFLSIGGGVIGGSNTANLVITRRKRKKDLETKTEEAQ